MHSDQLQHVKKRHDGILPSSWTSSPNVNYQKAKVIAAVAWHEVKDALDPELVNADLTFQENCIGIVESIMAGNEPDNTPFALKARALWQEATTQPTEEIAP